MLNHSSSPVMIMWSKPMQREQLTSLKSGTAVQQIFAIPYYVRSLILENDEEKNGDR